MAKTKYFYLTHMEVEAYLSLFKHEGSLGESCYRNLENVKVALMKSNKYSNLSLSHLVMPWQCLSLAHNCKPEYKEAC